MVSMDPVVLRKKLLNPPNEAQRQQTVDALKIVQTSQDDPHYENIVSLVRSHVADVEFCWKGNKSVTCSSYRLRFCCCMWKCLHESLQYGKCNLTL